ncbi:siroheme synthase CysG [Pseudoroseicyclus aestuarii]|uniref:Uroporphyrinogen-III C-methyltransferase n=1 Tax=Pseudoroseicyclus aestuarii TaxID=1795041 RepID=A0A318SWH8_9RHOB|nr:siroheme synthase CysG [Pseudoroseicyclus aestuarii]PYE85862.1 uroporphyrinogen-III C-methyltransferase [Pseudoroseicyclus aestuarii]
MQHYPIFLDLKGRDVALGGGEETALAKLRLLMKTEARLHVFSPAPCPELVQLADEGRLRLVRRAMAPGDADGMALVYAATEDDAEDARIGAIGRAAGALVNLVDNLQASDFITPAIVDRDPVTVAIGTEGAAPVLARAIKADLEERLPAQLGMLARLGKGFRHHADALPFGRRRRDFWSEFYFAEGPRAAGHGEGAVREALHALLARHKQAETRAGHVAFVGAGPGDPELLTLKARRLLHEADVVVHDRLVPGPILELARREALLIAAGKEGFGPSTPQSEINAMITEHARQGAQVVRLKGGDPSVFGRLDEETEALDEAGVAWSVVPGITAASAAAASLGRSLTRRGRNTELRLITGHDMDGFAEADWRALSRPGTVAGIYMGKRAARFIQGRLIMVGADPATPVTVVANASRPDQRCTGTVLGRLAEEMRAAAPEGPALLLLGLAPREAARSALRQEEAAL